MGVTQPFHEDAVFPAALQQNVSLSLPPNLTQCHNNLMQKHTKPSAFWPTLFSIVLLLLAGAGVYLLTSARGTVLLFGSESGLALAADGTARPLPELDKHIPAQLETALFALG